MDHLKCSYAKEGAGLFVWAKVPTQNGKKITDLVFEKSAVFITPGFIFGDKGKNYIRISLCAEEHRMKEALNRIKNVKW